MTDFYIQIIKRSVFWIHSCIFIEEMHMKYEKKLRNLSWSFITIILANYTFITLNQKSTQMH